MDLNGQNEAICNRRLAYARAKDALVKLVRSRVALDELYKIANADHEVWNERDEWLREQVHDAIEAMRPLLDKMRPPEGLERIPGHTRKVVYR